MLDKISTYMDSTNANDVYIRYAYEIRLNVVLMPAQNERIYIPTLSIIYREKGLSTILTQDKIGSSTISVMLLSS